MVTKPIVAMPESRDDREREDKFAAYVVWIGALYMPH